MVDGLQKISDKHLRILCRREVAETLHRLKLAARDLIARLLAERRRTRPIILVLVSIEMSTTVMYSSLTSPVSMYTGHFFVLMLDMRLRPSQPPKYL